MPKDNDVVVRRHAKRYSPTKMFEESKSDSSLENRLIRERKVNEVLNKLDTPIDRFCVGYGDFHSKLSDIKEIGRGGFGNVYSARIDGSPRFVIKEALLTPDEVERLKYSKGHNIIVRNSYPEEYRIMMMVNNALYSEACPNFLLTYNIGICVGCRNSMESVCYNAFQEPAIGNLNDLFSVQDNVAMSCVYQLLAGVYWIHSKYGIFHKDIKGGNILLLPYTNTGYSLYTVNGINYYVENVGYLFCIADFGISSVLKPSFTTQNYLGARNAKVEPDGTLKPFSSRYNLSFTSIRSEPTVSSDMKFITWEDSTISTNNVFSTTASPEPTEVVNLDDTLTFPPFDFYYDIQTVLATIVGGASFSPFQLVYNPGMPGISDKIKEYLSSQIVYPFPYSYDSARFVRADFMLHVLYTNYQMDDDREEDVTNTWVVDK